MMLSMLLLAATAQERFEAGDAAAALNLLEKSPRLSDPVWRYNRAVSAHAAGRLGRAMADYEWLTLRDPEDDAVRINRLLARLDRGAGDDAEPPLGQLARLPLRTIFVFGILAALVGLLRIRERDALFRLARLISSLSIFLLMMHHLLLALDSRTVTVQERALLERPEAKARSLLEIPEGNLLDAVEARDEWVKVRTGSGVMGWMKSGDLIELSGEEQ